LAVRQGLFHHLTPPAHHLEDVGGDAIDDRLLKFFAKDFTKKTSVSLKVAPAASDAVADLRAEARLRLALLHTKRTIAASFGGGSSTATCAVESLKDGLDYTGSVNRLRFDMEAAPIYAGVITRAGELLQRAGLDWVQVDEVVYAGGSACLPGLDATLAVRLRETATTPFFTGTVAGGGIGDPTTILARGAALQARLLVEIGGGTSVEDQGVRKAFERGSELVDVKATARTIGVLFPEGAESGGLGGQWIGGIQAETAVPARRTYALEVDLGEYHEGGEKLVGLEVWEVKEGVRVEKVKPPKDEEEDAESEEEEEEVVEVVERTISKEVFLGALAVRARQGRKSGSGWRASIEVQFLIEVGGKLQVSAYETGNEGTKDVIAVD
jgi:molecular chaperone DnaK (HSP70)